MGTTRLPPPSCRRGAGEHIAQIVLGDFGRLHTGVGDHNDLGLRVDSEDRRGGQEQEYM